MKLPVLNSIDDVVARQLCTGCGACAAVAPEAFAMADTLEHGRRPIAVGTGDAQRAASRSALAVCPGAEVRIDLTPKQETEHIAELRSGWGPVLEIWEGWATDETMRHRGSSGGAATAIALAAIESAGLSGVLHTRARIDQPILNETTLSTSREALLAAAGSRYAPASPGDGLPMIEAADGPCLFIGKPCDVVGARRVAERRPALARNLAGTMAIFCAGTPTTRATVRLLERLDVHDPRDVVSIRYRGDGWPGETRVVVRRPDGRLEERTLSYEESWGEVLTNDKQWRCHLCADHSGEAADLSVGDAWQDRVDGEPGRSLILVRTARGRELLTNAIASGSLEIRPVLTNALPRAQRNLLRGRGAVWGRLLACRLLLLPRPKYIGLPMFRFWRTELTRRERLQSVLGVAKRAIRRRLHVPISVRPWPAKTADQPDVGATPLPFSRESIDRTSHPEPRRAA
jgi:coenzyme F420 hydrogenase subunit beta